MNVQKIKVSGKYEIIRISPVIEEKKEEIAPPISEKKIKEKSTLKLVNVTNRRRE